MTFQTFSRQNKFLFWGRLKRGKKSGCIRRMWSCSFIILLVLFLICCILAYLSYTTFVIHAQTSSPAFPDLLNKTINHSSAYSAQSVFLLIDNSNSMFEKAGIGSDPNLLRMDAARLFISYLGIDDSETIHSIGLVFFGTTAQIILPLTSLNHEQRRTDILTLLDNPPRLLWTDHVSALQLTLSEILSPDFSSIPTSSQPVIVLLTDGKPEWAYEPTETEKVAYIEALKEEGEVMANAGIPFFLILLTNQATENDPDIFDIWIPIWREMSSGTKQGQFYTARTAADLPAIYHDIVVSLTGGQTDGIILDKKVQETTQEYILVEPNLAQLTFVISKSTPDISAFILQPNGNPLIVQKGVRHAGTDSEEIWVIDNPIPGDWIIHFNGKGHVTVWKDYRSIPSTSTPLPTHTLTQTPSPPFTPTTSLATQPKIAPTFTPAFNSSPAYPVISVTPLPFSPETSASLYNFPKWAIVTLVIPPIVGIAGTIYYKFRQTTPIVQGSLCHVSGPDFVGNVFTVDLDTFKKKQVVIGGNTADIPVLNSTHQFTIYAGNPIANRNWQIHINGTPQTLLNQQPIHNDHPPLLFDGDIINHQGTQLRYENLRLRREK